MTSEATAIHVLSILAGSVFLVLIGLILFLEFRNLIRGTRITATVLRIQESMSTDSDGHDIIDRFPEIEFVDPSGKRVVHKLALTNVTWRKPGEKLSVYYVPKKNEAGYKICSPFMWPTLLLLFFSCHRGSTASGRPWKLIFLDQQPLQLSPLLTSHKTLR